MKFTTLILITTLLQVSAATFGQKLTLRENNITLDKVFWEIRAQTGYDVLLSTNTIKNTRKINVNFNNTPLEQVMDKIIQGTNLSYTIDNKNVIIKQKLPSLIDKITTFFSSINVTGKIIDAETGKSIPKVNISLKGTNRRVVGDDYGTFMFNGLPEDGILVISSVGYLSLEVRPFNGMTIKLAPSTKVLDDVVVSTGYQQVKQGSTTGSFTVISAEEIAKTPSVNLMERLEGKIPGVQFNLRNNTIQIRGVSSYGTTPPLVVLDGFPALNQKLTNVTSGEINGNPNNQLPTETSGNAIISAINPADIESITFLKDAAAAAIWGANAANGVIVITTKKGRKGTSSINYSSILSTSAPANFKNMTSMTNRQYIDFEQELFDKGFFTDPLLDYRNTPVSEAEEWMFRVKRGTATPAQRDAALDVLANRSNRDQLKEYLLQRAVSQQHNLSFFGGGDNSSYYVSGNYTKDQPVFKSNSGTRYSVLSNLTNDFLNKRITLSTGIDYSYSNAQVNSAALQALSVNRFGIAPYQMLVDDNGNKIYNYITISQRAADSLVRVNKHKPWTYNPIDELNYNNTVTTNNSIRVNASVKGVVTDWLNLTVSGQLQKAITQQVFLQNKNSYLTRELYNSGAITTKGLITNGFPDGGVYKSSRTNADSYSIRAQFDVNKNLGTDHHFNMIGGTEIRQNKSNGSQQTVYGYDEDLSTSINVNTTSTGSYKNIYGYSSRFEPANGLIYRNTSRALSYYSTATYSYLDKYYATGSVRFDDLNLLGVDRRNRAKPLWSSGLRWDIKKEDFLSKVSWVNSLSLRATIGTGGNPPNTSANYSTIAIGLPDSYSQLPTSYVSSPANQNIGWETTRTTNGGVDASLFNNRLNLSFDIYNKRTYDILMSLPINGTYGYTSLAYNAGDLSGHGTEFSVSGAIIKTKNWGWNSDFNISYNTNTVTDSRFPNMVVTGGVSQITTGLPTDNLFVYRWAGLDNTGQSQIYAADGTKISSTGLDDRPLVPGDLINAGRTTAPYFGGFSNTVSYKNLSFSVRATYYLGNVFLLQTINPNYYPKDGQFGAKGQYSGLLGNNSALASRWRKLGDEAFTNIPGITNSSINSLNMFDNSDYNIRNGGNIRLQQITLAYNLPKSVLRRMPFIKNINMGLTVSNLGVLWVANKEGIDPEYQMTNEFNNLPPTRNYVFNINLTL